MSQKKFSNIDFNKLQEAYNVIAKYLEVPMKVYQNRNTVDTDALERLRSELKSIIGEESDLGKKVYTFRESSYMYLCAILVSHALNKAGCVLPEKYSSCAIDSGKDYKYFIRAAELRKYLISIGGQATEYSIMNEIANKKGIIFFGKCFTDASGHIDIWNGEKVLGHDYSDRTNVVIELLEIKSSETK